MSSIREAPAATLRRLAHIQRLLEPGVIRPVYQPIVRLSDLQAVGYEGLARFPHADGLAEMPPDLTLAAAGEVGLRGDLEVACWAAMATAGSPPGGGLLFVNISPDALPHPGLLALADRLPSRLVIEITEQREVQDYAELREALAPWVARGAQVAIDDTGAGYASLEHVVEMRPDFLKLTRGLVADIDHDANRQALLRALSAFAREVGASIVAEGVERVEELEVLRDSDVDFVQGWLLGRPGAPWPEVQVVDPPERPVVVESAVRRLSTLERTLASAGTVKGAASAIVEHLARMGLMPAVYLEHGGRLRCEASRGYWTVHDGIRAGTGVVGRAYDGATTVHESDVDAVDGYLGSVQAVKAEVAVPLRLGSRVVGVLNVESLTPLGAGPALEVERCALLLSRRLAELGPLERPSAGQRLARAAVQVAAAEDPDAIVRAAAGAALEVSGMETVLVALRGGDDGAVEVVHVAGPLAGALGALRPEDVAAWGASGTTMLSMSDAGGKALPVLEPLRRAGAGAVMVVPLTAGRSHVGFLALADRSSLTPDVERTELTELLAVQTAAQLRGVSAAQDPVTGLRRAGSFHRHLAQARRAAEPGARPVAVLLADVDADAGDEVLRGLAALFAELAPQAGAFRLSAGAFAVLLDAADRTDAQAIAWQLQALARDRVGTTLSIGVAVADRGESDARLLARADQALTEVKRRGRDGVALAPVS